MHYDPMPLILCVSVVSLFGNYLLDVFYNTPSPAQWTNTFRRKNKKDSDYLYTRGDFDSYLFGKAPTFIFNLLGCRYCLSLHVSFWLSVLLVSLYAPLYLFLPVWLISTGIMNCLHRYENHQEEPNSHHEELPTSSPETARRNGVNMVKDPTTNSYKVVSVDPERSTIVGMLKSETLSDNPIFSTLQTGFRTEIIDLKSRNPECPPCEQNAIMDKYYEKLLAAYKDANTRGAEQV